MIRPKLLRVYAFLFSRKAFHRFNRGLFQLSLRGLGILNFENNVASGEKCFLHKHLSRLKSPTVLDVGANEGNYTAAVLQENGSAIVYAFEPHPSTFDRLRLRTSAQKRVTAINAACGKAPGQLTLFDYAGSQGSTHASLYPEVVGTSSTGERTQHLVQVINLDTFARENNIQVIDLLKIDTEGHELEVLRGAEQLIREHRIRAIQFEFNEMNIASRVFFKDFCNLLPNYRFFRMVRDGLIELDPYSPVRCELFVFQNVVAIPHEEAS